MFKINWASVLFGAIGIAIGYYLNVYANKISNEQLLAQFKAELQKELQDLKNQNAKARVAASPESINRQVELESEIKAIESLQARINKR